MSRISCDYSMNSLKDFKATEAVMKSNANVKFWSAQCDKNKANKGFCQDCGIRKYPVFVCFLKNGTAITMDQKRGTVAQTRLFIETTIKQNP